MKKECKFLKHLKEIIIKKCKKVEKIFAISKKSITFALEITIGLVAQLNSASDYGSEGYRFESCRGHKFKVIQKG